MEKPWPDLAALPHRRSVPARRRPKDGRTLSTKDVREKAPASASVDPHRRMFAAYHRENRRPKNLVELVIGTVTVAWTLLEVI